MPSSSAPSSPFPSPASAHDWLCHPDGSACPDGCAATPDPARLHAYESLSGLENYRVTLRMLFSQRLVLAGVAHRVRVRVGIYRAPDGSAAPGVMLEVAPELPAHFENGFLTGAYRVIPAKERFDASARNKLGELGAYVPVYPPVEELVPVVRALVEEARAAASQVLA